jgi:preprotein translocase subunit SecE
VTEDRESGRNGRNRPSSAAGRRARQTVSAGDAGKGRPTPSRDGRASRGSIPARVVRFLREVIAELRKVIWPTRKEMITYTTVVLIFVAFMVALVALLDLVFAQGVLILFG